MAFDVNEFISIKPIVDQLNQNPNSKIKISKSQSRVLANMPEDKFNSFLDLMRRPFGQPNPPTNSSIFIQNMEAIQSTRDQRLAARVNNSGFLKAARLKQEKEEARKITSNFIGSQKEAVDFLKQEKKPLNFLNKPHQSKIEARRFGKSVEEMLEEEKLFIKNYEEFDRFRSGDTRFMDSTRRMPPMLDRPTINQPLTNIGAEKRLDSFRRAQQARVSTQGGQNTPIQQASSVTPPPRTSSRVAQMLGEDTVRAASVIHSSKMNYATVGLAGMAAVFGIASASRQRANMEQEIQSRF
jgi:hypothetical protein